MAKIFVAGSGSWGLAIAKMAADLDAHRAAAVTSEAEKTGAAEGREDQ